MAVDDALFEGNDGVVGDVNLFGTDLGTAFSNIAIPDAELVLQ